jgi:hypothetical protein
LQQAGRDDIEKDCGNKGEHQRVIILPWPSHELNRMTGKSLRRGAEEERRPVGIANGKAEESFNDLSFFLKAYSTLA